MSRKTLQDAALQLRLNAYTGSERVVSACHLRDLTQCARVVRINTISVFAFDSFLMYAAYGMHKNDASARIYVQVSSAPCAHKHYNLPWFREPVRARTRISAWSLLTR